MTNTVTPSSTIPPGSDVETEVGNGFLMELSEAFRDQSKNLNIALQSALEKLKNNPSDPAALAEYQSALSQYTLYRNAQSSVVKAYKDVGAGIIANYR
ncbi:type III secretion system needle filament subunit SctF [Glaciimonas sp. PCH181]|uniref:type III secretion system needle filament subunit SctF n=1 Tax=Glaciimonas sp. PCH181 TaxID=2133943 RepID=UPI002677D4AC|nr:type III secretion system needle filament subunit SctF [Glaciimonas sp. PCH181]